MSGGQVGRMNAGERRMARNTRQPLARRRRLTCCSLMATAVARVANLLPVFVDEPRRRPLSMSAVALCDASRARRLVGLAGALPTGGSPPFFALEKLQQYARANYSRAADHRANCS